MWKPSSVVVVCPPQRIECDKMEEVSSIELTVATFTDYRLECIESGIYQLVHASAEKFFAKPFLSLTIIIKKNHKKPHYFNRICRFGSNKSRRVNLPRQSFDGCKFSFKKKKKTLVNAGHILPSNKRIFHNFTPSIRFKKPVHLNAFVAVY